MKFNIGYDMNPRPNAFLSTLPTRKPKTEKPEEFLNTITDMTRDMYIHKKEDVPIAENRFEGDMLLNQGVRKKNTARSNERMIVDMKEEIKRLNQKMTFVIEKDEEIYRLKCDNEHLKNDVSEYQKTTVTDETLTAHNTELIKEISEIQEERDALLEESIQLKQKLIQYHKENDTLRKTQSHVSLGNISDEMLGSFVRSRLPTT